jgi:PAS domain S-box-containing protein
MPDRIHRENNGDALRFLAGGEMGKYVAKVLRARDEELEAILNGTPFMLTRCGRDLRYRFVSRACAVMLGRQPEDVCGKAIVEIIGEEGFQSILPHIQKVLAGERVEYESSIHYDGVGTRSVHVVYTPDRDEQGNVHGWVASILDLTERQRAEAALRERTTELSRTVATLQKEVDRRTAAEQGLRQRSEQLRALADELTQVEQRERQRLAMILHDHVQQLIVGVRLRVSAFHLQMDAPMQDNLVRINQLLDECLRTCRTLTAELTPPILTEAGLAGGLTWLVQRMAERHGLAVRLVKVATIPPLPADVNSLLFESIRELLFNVVKYAGVAAARLEAKLTAGQLLLSVVDKGGGFDPAQVKIGGAESGAESGAAGGLGLFRIRERLGSIGGQMDIESSPGKGTRVTLTVPLQSAESAPCAAARPSQAQEPVSAASVDPGTATRIRVLITDDHAVVRDGLALLLSRQPDMEIVGQAADGHQAVELARRLQPEVVLMDVSMPKLNGIEATRLIHQELPLVKIIGLSVFEECERAQTMMDAGAFSYLNKSRASDELVSAIRSCVASLPPGTRSGVPGSQRKNGKKSRSE